MRAAPMVRRDDPAVVRGEGIAADAEEPTEPTAEGDEESAAHAARRSGVGEWRARPVVALIPALRRVIAAVGRQHAGAARSGKFFRYLRSRVRILRVGPWLEPVGRRVVALECHEGNKTLIVRAGGQQV